MRSLSRLFRCLEFKADTDNARKYVGLNGKTDPKTQKQVTENMLGPNVLDVDKHPTAKFKIDSAIATGKRSPDDHPFYELRGNFILHGTSQPLKFVAEAIDSKDSIDSIPIRGQFTILQTEYGIKPFKMALGAVGVADELKIWGEIDLDPSSKQNPARTR